MDWSGFPASKQDVQTGDPALIHLFQVIKGDYGVDVALKPKTLLKFGQNLSVGTTEASLMTLAGSEVAETYVDTNVIDRVVSDDDSNTQTLRLEGHSIDGSGNFNFIVQSVTLTGQTPVTLSTPVCRTSRSYVSSGATLAANSKVYFYESTSTVTSGVPQTASKVHLIVLAGDNGTEKAATTFSYLDYGLITHIYGGVNKKTAASADIYLKIKAPGAPFRTILKRSVNSAGKVDFDLPLKPYMLIPRNHDILMTGIASTGDVSLFGGFNVYIATQINPTP